MPVSDRIRRTNGSEETPVFDSSALDITADENLYLLDMARRYHGRLLAEQNLDEIAQLPAKVLRARIETLVSNMMKESGETLPPPERSGLISFLVNEVVGLGPLERLAADPGISEIMVNGPNDVYIERKGKLTRRSDIRFQDEKHIAHIVDRIISPLGRRVDESSPMVDARLPNGRVNAVIHPVSLNGPILTIRRFRREPFSVQTLIDAGTLSEDMADFLKACVVAKQNILVSGGTGSGKTTTLNVLASFIPWEERVITIEDAAELQFHLTHPHVVRMESRPKNVEGKGEITIRDCVKNALRMRPDRIIVGEVRHAEALDMLQAMNTGHEGSLTTVHANSSLDAFSRLETMVMWAEGAKELPLAAIREHLVGALNIVIQQDRMPDGSRKIVAISEVQGMKKGHIVLKDIFIFERTGADGKSGRILGSFTPTGIRPKCLPRLKSSGMTLSGSMFQPQYLVAEMGADILEAEDVTEIMVNGPNEVYVERRGNLEKLDKVRFRDETHLINVINSIVAPLGRRIDETNPTVDARLPDGSRVNAVLAPIALNGPVLTIRRFPKDPLKLENILAGCTLSPEMAKFLEACVRAKQNILVSGGTGSGKTTTLNILSAFIPATERIITIEDVAELQLKQPHVVRLETRPADEYGEGEVSIRTLVRNALRMRPNRIIVGEVRGGEALDMLQAMNTGHEGSLTTVHANSAMDAFSRLETMVMLSGLQLPSHAIREQMVGALNVVLQQDRMSDGSRKIVAISEIQSVDQGQIKLKDLFVFEQTGLGPNDQVIGRFKATGQIPKVLPRLRSFGMELNEDFFQARELLRVNS